MRRAHRTLIAVAAVASGLEITLNARHVVAAPRQPATFRPHVIDTALADGYQAVVADMNRDGKPDIIAVASGLSEVRWYENPSWRPHVLVRGVKDPINAAAYDVDGDGIPEIALAHDFSNVVRESVGTLSILTHAADVNAEWTRRDIEHVPTSHRVRFVDIDGSGKRVLVNAPLIGGKAVAPEYRDHTPLLKYRPGAWTREVIGDGDEGVVRGLLPFTWDSGPRESVLTAWSYQTFVEGARVKRLNERKRPCQRSPEQITFAGNTSSSRLIESSSPLRSCAASSASRRVGTTSG